MICALSSTRGLRRGQLIPIPLLVFCDHLLGCVQMQLGEYVGHDFLYEGLMKEIRMPDSMRPCETGLLHGYLGTTRKKGRHIGSPDLLLPGASKNNGATPAASNAELTVAWP